MEDTTASGQPIVLREKTTPFLIRAFVKVGTFHKLNLFEDGTIPTTDESQLFTWKDATLRELLTTLRDAPNGQTAEFRHPLARFSFRAVYADAANKGRFVQKDLGIVYSRDILGEPGSLDAPAPRLVEDTDGEARNLSTREREERTLDELRFVPGDYLCIAILLPKGTAPPAEITIKGAGAPPPVANGWRAGGRPGDSGWGGPVHAPAPVGRGGGHWRGNSDAPPPAPRGRGRDFAGRDRDFDRGRDARDLDRRPPPPRRESPPHRGGWGGGRGGGRGGGGGGRRSPSLSRSRSPPRRRGSRYD
ncbi:hypothetical protein CONPUDRAFT_111054, partial [Coniophora puteana RWD-64-598 SS2]